MATTLFSTLGRSWPKESFFLKKEGIFFGRQKLAAKVFFCPKIRQFVRNYISGLLAGKGALQGPLQVN